MEEFDKLKAMQWEDRGQIGQLRKQTLSKNLEEWFKLQKWKYTRIIALEISDKGNFAAPEKQ